MPDRPIRVWAAALLMAGLAGCQAKPEPEVWMPKPRVHWEHVSTDPVIKVDEGYRILLCEPTQGFFPASVGVTRLAIEVMDEDAHTTKPILLTDPRNEFLQWNRALDDLMAVSEVFPIVERDLGGQEADPPQIIAATRALHAKLGLVYAVNELSPTEAEMFGVLYDTAKLRPMASVHARAVSVPPPDPEQEQPPNPWETDARALVRQKFERRMHACIREIIEQDQPRTTDAPSGWTPAGPIRPVEWPPRHFRTGRP